MLSQLAADNLKIDWANGPTYNTVMALAAGVGLLLVVDLGRRLRRDDTVGVEGYAVAFAVLGTLLTATGLHMTLTWPLAPIGFPFDNIIFGEPSLVFGVILLAAAVVLVWKKAVLGVAAPGRHAEITRLMGPTSLLGVGIGLGCFGIAAAGIRFQLFVAPPQEPISGQFSQWPWLEISFICSLYILTGLGAVLLPLALRRLRGAAAIVVGAAWGVAGLAFLLFGALNYFTHIGLIVNTM